jgi:hypothetical protein
LQLGSVSEDDAKSVILSSNAVMVKVQIFEYEVGGQSVIKV